MKNRQDLVSRRLLFRSSSISHPFGYPRYVDLPTIRRLAAVPYVEMCITTIIDEACAVPWDIVVKEGKSEDAAKPHIEHVKSFFDNPNTNQESFEEIRRKYIRDILEIDAGVINKVFNQAEEMVEIVARAGDTFTKNPDIYGMMTDRDDIILGEIVNGQPKENLALDFNPMFLSAAQAREKAAYFQYGWVSGARPVPFGKKEIVWLERNPRTDSIYGRSPVQILAETIQTLIYAIEHNLEYFNDNSIPKGILGFEGADAEEMKALKEQWEEQQKKQDSDGNWKKDFHKMPMMGRVPKFERLQFSNAELELLEGQKWWAKLVWSVFGVTSVELGYTEDAKGLANQIVQSNVFKKRTLYPLLRLEEYRINKELISEFGYDDIEFKFIMFDVDEEMKKAQLYQTQINAGFKSINEIRLEEGLEQVEWGEKMSEQERFDQQNQAFGSMEQEYNEESEDDNSKKKDLKAELKYKYIKRTGSPGNYKYWYRDPKTGKLTTGKKPESTEKGGKPEELEKINNEEKVKEYIKYTNPSKDQIEEINTFKGFYANQNDYKKNTFYHLTPNTKITKEELLRGESTQFTEQTGSGLYTGRDKKALESFYGEMAGHEEFKIVEFEGTPNILDLSNEKDLQNSLKEAKKKYPNDKNAIKKYVIEKGYDGMRYFDVVATGEEFVFYKTDSFKVKKTETKAIETKYKYIKRTGSPGNYRYWYRDSSGKLVSGEKPEEGRIKKENIETAYENIMVGLEPDEFFGLDDFKKYSKEEKEIILEEAKKEAIESMKKNDTFPEKVKKEKIEEIENLKIEEKSLSTENPLILRENEVLDDNRLERSIVYLLKKNEQKIKELIEKEVGQNKIKEIKSVDDIIKAIKGILTFEGLKTISDAVIRNTFTKGWENAEKQLNRNILVNKEALDYIQDYTFSNIKNMTEEIANDLRQELQRGIIEGEGITKIKARVSKVFDVGETRAEMIAITESARAEGQGQLQAFKSSGQKLKKRIVITHDERTSPLCKRLEGQTVGINEKFKDKKTGEEWDVNPFHVRCRSVVAYLSEDEE